ncbi:naa30 [Candida pseudojiufengensis]|uniref:naa30 n=1 Tax=Candida pseudojiufengensis TaxID=497109 RepID=UPI0022242A3E|nr:naa30 [Candida pseudojiufengensis]KAI5961362.1 naa30 [Candida pseudojiufengensis]
MSLKVDTIDGYSYYRFNIKEQEEFKQISNLISSHLSEPYSIYVYWYFLNNWPEYCFTIKETINDVNNNNDKNNGSTVKNEKIIGVIISKLEPHRQVRNRGYIGMLVIDPKYRKRGLAKNLVKITINKMIQEKVDEIMLETEVINDGALKLYESFGFLRVKRLYRYYLNTHDAFRLILPLSDKSHTRIAFLPSIIDENNQTERNHDSLAINV